jgi:hypothetical protein
LDSKEIDGSDNSGGAGEAIIEIETVGFGSISRYL